MIELMALISLIIGVIVKYSFRGYGLIRNVVNKYLIYLGLPLMILVAIHGTDLGSLGHIALVSFLVGFVLITSFFIIVEFTSYQGRDKASLFLCSAFGNTAFLGIPIGFLLFGSTGAIVAGIMSFVMMLFRYTLGLLLSTSFINRKLSLKKYASKPFIWLLLAAFIVAQFSFHIPRFITNLSSITIYLAVFVVGLSLDIGSLTEKTAYLSLFKIVLAPLIALPVILVSNTPYMAEFILLAAMPSAFLNTALALEYNFNHKLSSGLTTVGTLVFVVFFGIYVIITTL